MAPPGLPGWSPITWWPITGNWYLLALNTAAGRMETFALSRCRSIEGTRQHFARPVGFDAPTFFKDAFGISQADRPWKVRLLFAREVATYIRERTWHVSQELRQRRDGALELRLQTSSRKELTRWILSWMPHVKVLAPRQLRERVPTDASGLGSLRMTPTGQPRTTSDLRSTICDLRGEDFGEGGLPVEGLGMHRLVVMMLLPSRTQIATVGLVSGRAGAIGAPQERAGFPPLRAQIVYRKS